jgi:ATP-binding cassette, subfamily B, bacterial
VRHVTANRLLVEAARRAPWWSGLFVLAMVAGTVSRLVLPAALAAAVDAALRGRAFGVALAGLGAVLAVSTLANLVTLLAGSCYAALTGAWLRHRLFGHTLELGLIGQRQFAAGDVLARLLGDVPGAGQVLPALVGIAVAVVATAGAVVALWLIDWRLAATFLTGLPLMFVIARGFVVRASALFVAYQRAQAAIAARLVDALAGLRTIAVSGTSKREIGRILVPLDEVDTCGRALWDAQRQVSWQAGLLVPGLELLVLAVAGFGVAARQITPGQLLAATGYVRLALGMFEKIDALMGIVQARASAVRVVQVLAVARWSCAGSRYALVMRAWSINSTCGFLAAAVSRS